MNCNTSLHYASDSLDGYYVCETELVDVPERINLSVSQGSKLYSLPFVNQQENCFGEGLTDKVIKRTVHNWKYIEDDEVIQETDIADLIGQLEK